MHIHLPKPLHGWREFAGEVGIIVVGVLIALGAEQMVESIHLRWQTRQAQEALRAEIHRSYTAAYERHAVHACLGQQLDSIEKAILSSGSKMTPLPTFGDEIRGKFVYRAPSRPWVSSVWQNVKGEDVFGNMSADMRQSLTRYYTQLEYMQRMNDEEDKSVGQMMALSKPIPLDASVKANAIELLEDERSRNDLMDTIASQMMKQAESLGDAPPAQLLARVRQNSGTINFCKSHVLGA